MKTQASTKEGVVELSRDLLGWEQKKSIGYLQCSYCIVGIIQ